MIDLRCPRCGRMHHAGEEHIGKSLKCAGCGDTISIVRSTDSYVPTDAAIDTKRQKAARVTPISRHHARRSIRERLPVVIKRAWVYLLLLLIAVASPLVYEYLKYHSEDARTDRKIQQKVAQKVLDKRLPSTEVPSLKTAVVQSDPQSVYTIEPPKKEITLPVSTVEAARPPNTLASCTRIIEDQAVSGKGQLETYNGTPYDACVIVVDESKGVRVREVYIKAHESCSLEHLDPGIYRMMFTTGVDWDADNERFKREPSYFEFGKLLSFEQSRDTQYDHYERHSITLSPVTNGNVERKSVSEEEFHALSGRR